MTQCMLLAVDGSQGGDRALEYSIAQVKDRDIKLVVAYVIEWSLYSFNTPEENAERHKRREGEISRAKRRLLIRQWKNLQVIILKLSPSFAMGHRLKR